MMMMKGESLAEGSDCTRGPGRPGETCKNPNHNTLSPPKNQIGDLGFRGLAMATASPLAASPGGSLLPPGGQAGLPPAPGVARAMPKAEVGALELLRQRPEADGRPVGKPLGAVAARLQAAVRAPAG